MSKLIGIRNKILRTDFSSFLVKTFHTVNPGTEFLPNWHINLIAEYLQACESGEVKRLIINLPPRALKSLIVSVAWPAWLLGKNPARRVIAASYAQSLSNKHSLDCRRVVTSDWYKKVFPEFQIASGQNQKAKFMTTKRGYRIATSVGGSITGEGGNFLIIDDPHNPVHINSAAKRRNVIEWFDKTFSTRLDNKKKGVFVLVMQRLHEEDLSGHLAEKGWEILAIPAIAEEKKTYARGKLRMGRKRGELLQAERENIEEIEKAKKDLGSGGFAAQYQQNPLAAGGNMINPEWIRRYDAKPSGTIFQSWDTAIKTGENNDFSVCAIWNETVEGYNLLDIFRARLEYPLLKKEMIGLAEKWKPAAILIEDQANGQSLIQELRKKKNLPVIAIKSSLSKIERAAKISCLIEAGKVFLPRQAIWLAEYEREIFGFPGTKYDDQMDSTSQFLEWITGRTPGQARIRSI